MYGQGGSVNLQHEPSVLLRWKGSLLFSGWSRYAADWPPPWKLVICRMKYSAGSSEVFLKLKEIMLKGYFVCFWRECIYLRVVNFWDLWWVWNLNSAACSSMGCLVGELYLVWDLITLITTTFWVVISNLNCWCTVQIIGYLRLQVE